MDGKGENPLLPHSSHLTQRHGNKTLKNVNWTMGVRTSSKEGRQRSREKVKATCECRACQNNARIISVGSGVEGKCGNVYNHFLSFKKNGLHSNALVGIRERQLRFKSRNRKGTQEGEVKNDNKKWYREKKPSDIGRHTKFSTIDWWGFESNGF